MIHLMGTPKMVPLILENPEPYVPLNTPISQYIPRVLKEPIFWKPPYVGGLQVSWISLLFTALGFRILSVNPKYLQPQVPAVVWVIPTD